MTTNTAKWGAYGTYTDSFAAQALKNMASAAGVLSNEIDNTTTRYQYLDLDFLFRAASAPTAGLTLDVYLVPAVDGTNYADASATGPVTPLTNLIATFPSRNVNTAQRVARLQIMIPPAKFKLYVLNSLGQALTNTNDENVLSYRMYYQVSE